MAGEFGQYRVFSKYRLIARLGSGGMAEVFLALTGSPKGFNKLQVLKVLRSDLPERERADFVRMFQDEGRLAARLSHPNIVQSHEVGSEEGHEFIAMEYLEGQPLSNVQERAWLEKPPSFPLEMQLHVLCLVLEGLDYAHNLTDYGDRRLNIVHRDVSPQNVFITYSGHVKLVDFGIAKTLESSKTRAGVVKGKVPYMSPEQVLGGGIDRRADLFSVGVMLWEAIACQPMHGTASVYEILRRLVQGELPSIREAAPDVPEPLAKILDRALSLKPEHRYPDAAVFREELASYLEGRKVSTRAIGERVSSLFAEERREINEVIRCALTETSEDPGSSPFNEVHLLPTLKVLAARVSTAQTTGPTTAPSTTPPLQGTTPPPVQMATAEPAKAPPNKLRILAVVGAALALVLVLSVVSRSPSKAPQASESVAAPSPAGSATPEVRLSVVTHPDSATLTLDGKELGPSPYSGTRARDGKQHDLVVSAAGHQPRTLSIRLDHDVDLEVGLAQSPAQAASTPASAAKPVSARKETAPAPRPRVGAAKKPDDADPYRDLPAQKRAGTTVPPLDTSESPW
ncbi:MAG TPA: serine/threonine-protein kinase [Polyangiaceae bacterium]|nr:serine/threonine-protein kinase [Polyangiaceae bacterium]HYQ25779.1 serine/threonine-protein kinase [Polyangiaceae bacterium]